MQDVPLGFRLRFQVFLVCRSRKLSPVNGLCPRPYFVGGFISDTAYGGNGGASKTCRTAYTGRTQPVHTTYIRCRLLGALQHSKKVTWIVWVSDHIEVVKVGCVFDFAVDIAQCGEVFDRKADTVKKRDLIE